jgi:EmrB/QacA subfamily drug resistance transporter
MTNQGAEGNSGGEHWKRWTLVAMILCSGVVFLQSSVINVALPKMGQALQTGLSGLQWIVDGYILTLSALLILGGSLGDRYGRCRTMTVGLFGFGLTSIVCGVAPTAEWLIGARVLQGVAGALLVPGSLAIIRDIYVDREARGEAIGQWSGWSGIVTVIGPLVGGWLVTNLSWRWVFFVPLPVLAAAIWLMFNQVPESRAENPPDRVDWLGALLVTMGLGGLAYGLIEGPAIGWTSAGVLIGLVGGAVSLVLFPFVEGRQREPMVPLQLFESRNFNGANLATLGVYFALQGTTFFVVLYLQNVMGYSALAAGMVLAPMSLVLLLLSPVFGRLAGERGPRLFMTVGPLGCAAGLLLFTRLSRDAAFWTEVLPAVLVFGLGMSATVAPLTQTVMSAVADEHSGIAAAFNNAASRVARLLAVAGLGVVVSVSFGRAIESRTEGLSLSPASADAVQEMVDEPTGSFDVGNLSEEAREAVTAAYTVAFRRAMVASGVMAAAGGIVAGLIVRNRPSEDAE